MSAVQPKPRVQLFSRQSQAIFFNFKPAPVQRMLDFDTICNREKPSVAGVVSPGATDKFHKAFFGTREVLIPIYGSTEEAAAKHPNADIFITYASFRSAFVSCRDALEISTIHTIIVLAEGVPERETKELVRLSKEKGKVVIGPATVGGIQAGAFKIADAAGTIENVIQSKLYRPGSVGFVSKSGGMSNELYNILSKTTDGLFEGIAIGGDVFPASTLTDHVLRFQHVPEIKMVVILGELGGEDEYGVVEAFKRGEIKKPILAWVSGGCARMFPQEVQFGHAGAKSGSERTSAQAKLDALKAAGAHVPISFEKFPELIKKVFDDLVAKGVIVKAEEPPVPYLPTDFAEAVRTKKVRRATNITSTICDDRGDEPLYGGFGVRSLVDQGAEIGDVISLLWFKRQLPKYATKFMSLILMLVADHGPCVSGAHNTIVAARAGKDLVSSVCSGLLTIGPRFGGAIDDAARVFKKGHDQKTPADVLVETMKKEGKKIPGIGHRIKSATNPDARVELMVEYAKANFSSLHYWNYAKSVEKYTLSKQTNLILNVDGTIATLFLDLMVSSGMFSAAEINDVVETGYLNGFFVLGRTIGLVGHSLDQQRLKQPLYRHPWDDVLFDS